MRWFRRGAGKQEQTDSTAARALVDDVRARYGAHLHNPFQGQAAACAAQLAAADEDGLLAAAMILHEFADDAHRDISTQLGHLVDRRNYRPQWRHPRGGPRWNLFALPGRLHPYIHVGAAAALLGDQAKRTVRVTAPVPVLAHVFEILDLTVIGWEFARVRPDTDLAGLAHRLIGTARDLRAAMSDEPPLPDPVRELMRRNNTIDVYDPQAPHVVGRFNPGKEMREALLA
ncbi:hypothetical protein [Paractinoplanes lichenicola]|uniref:Uncharacterized protein n=1 Tax=Paractinoplanes lichenicola TaxID=2802976 RepID=A0ABS1VNK6_9ACTN|nr:hypothetical protein [Actinoplanes lichenicola]MBL7255327.1 hypothetical protein [Actinoplanes lichenicola]